jgi:hypothetical protein
MDKNDDRRQKLLLEIMTNTGALGPAALSDELLCPWQGIAAHLSPLIGESGFCALFLRTTRLVEKEFDWLASTESSKSIERSLRALGASYDSLGPLEARACNATLLNTFTKLLADLIGEAITLRLLHSASSGEGEKKNVQEHK